MVYTLRITLTIRTVRAGGDFVNPKKLVEDVRELREKCRPLSESMLRGSSHRGAYYIDEDVSCALGCDLDCSDREHVPMRRLKWSVRSKKQVPGA